MNILNTGTQAVAVKSLLLVVRGGMYLDHICRERVYFPSFTANGAAHEERWVVRGYPKSNSQIIS